MEIKVIRCFGDSTTRDLEKRLESEINRLIKEGYRIHGNMVAVPRIYEKSNFVDIYQYMIRD